MATAAAAAVAVRPWRPLRAAAIGVFAACAAGFLLFPLAVGWARGHFEHAIWSYNAASTALSWFDTGFARRELEGTLIRLFTADPLAGGAAFHALAYTALAALAFAATLKAPVADGRRLAIGLVFLAVLDRVGADVGRADPAVMACGFIAAWAAKSGRWAIAALALGVAVQFHETGLIVFAPVAAAVAYEHGAFQQGARRRSGRASLVLGLAVAAAGLAAYALALTARPDVQAAARAVHAKFPDPAMADLSVYYTLSGARGVAGILCQQQLDGAYVGKVVKGAVLIGLCATGLQPRRWATALAAALAPYLLLSAIAVDIGRWTVFAVFAVAVMATLAPAEAEAVAPEGRPLSRLRRQLPRRAGEHAVAVVVAALLVFGVGFVEPMDPAPLIPNPWFGQPSLRLNALGRASHCDPGWRRFLGVG